MSDIMITIPAGSSTRLLTKDKFCTTNIVVKASAGGGGTVSGTRYITANGVYDISQYATVSVDVPIPEGYVKPAGNFNIATNGSYNIADYSSVSVNVPSSSANSDKAAIALIEGNKDGYSGMTALPDGLTEIKGSCFYNSNIAITAIPDTVTRINSYAFGNCDRMRLSALPSSLTHLEDDAFTGCDNIYVSEIPAGVTYFGNHFPTKAGTVTFKGTPTTIATDAFFSVGTFAVKTINVPWAEGAVAGAPWGATGATINYNHKG